MKRRLLAIESFWMKAEEVFIAICGGMVVFLAASQIFLRNFSGSGWIWADSLVRHLVLVVGFLGASLATSEASHISIDALSRFVKGRFIRITKGIVAVATIVISLALFWAAIDFVAMERAEGTSLAEGYLPAWIIELVIPYTFLSVAIRTFFHTFIAPPKTEKPLRGAVP